VTATVNVAGTLPGSTQLAAGMVGVVEHVTGTDTPGYTGSGVLLGEYEFTLDENGTETLYFDECVDDLEGTVYEIHIAGKTVRIQPTTAGTWLLGDPAIAAPPGLPPVAYTPPELIDPDAYGIDVVDGLASYNRMLLRGFIDPLDFGAANNGVTDDSAALQAAIDAAVATARPLILSGAYLHASTLEWTPTGPLTLYADDATLTYTGSGYAWDLDMDSGAAALPTVTVHGGTFVGSASADGCFYQHDARRTSWDRVEVVDFPNGPAWHVENEGRWSERNTWTGCASRDNRQAFLFDLYTTSVTNKATASLVATLTIGTHRFQVGDRVHVELDTPDADYDSSNRQITAVTATTISFATTGGDEATTAATGIVRSKSSFARTRIRDLELQGGVSGVAHVEFHQNAGPYDSVIDGIRGNIADGSIVIKLAGGAMGGTTISRIGVERQTSGTVYAVQLPDDTATGQRPTYVSNVRVTSDPDSGGEGVELYEGTDPAESPFLPQTIFGGINTDAYVEALLGIILRISTTHPVLGDWPSNPDVGTLLLRDGNNGTPLVTELVARTSSGFRTAALLNRRTTSGAAAPSDGTWTRGDICWNESPSVGAPSFWQCVTTGTPGTWAASPNLV
jgi:hypothetical protein